MTVQELKNNREVIIERATKTFGESEVKNFMIACKEQVENCWTEDNINLFLNDMVEKFRDMQFEASRNRKSSKLAELHCNNHIDEKYRLVTKQFNKI